MNDFNQKKSSAPIIGAIVAVLLLAIAGYAYVKNNADVTPQPVATEETATTQTPTEESATTDVPAASEEEKPAVVVETKKLDLGTETKTETAPPSASITDPAVKTMMEARTLGNAAAPAKITEYSSLTCTHCGAFHRESFEKFKTEFVDTGKVQITFKEFPLNPPALDASMILRCMPADKFVNFMSLLFQEQDKWAFDANYKDQLRQYAKLGGMSDETFDSCLANNTLKEAIVADMKAASDTYKVQSTPSFVINGGRVLVGNQPMEAFAEAISQPAATPATTDAVKPAPTTSSQEPVPAPEAVPPAEETDAPPEE